MTQQELNEKIKKALTQDVDLSEEEYAAKTIKADDTTKKHGVKGKASINESRRARRMAMNFYGVMLNTLVNIHATMLEQLAATHENNRLLATVINGGVDVENVPETAESEVNNE